MIIPLASKSVDLPHNYLSREELTNCYPVFNEEGAEFPVTICMRRGTVLKEAAAGDYMGFDRQDLGAVSAAFSGAYLFTDKCIHTEHFASVAGRTFTPLGTVTSNPVSDGVAVYYGTADGIRRYEWDVGHTHHFFTGYHITHLAILNGYFWAYSLDDRRFYISKFREYTNIEVLDHIQVCQSELAHLIIYNDEAWLFFRDEKVTVYANDIGVSPPFARVTAATLDIMPDGAVTPLVDHEALYFVGSDHHIYSVQGYSPQRISTFSQASTVPAKGDAWLDITPDDTGNRRLINFPTGFGAWVYDPGFQTWHRREGVQANGGFIQYMASSGAGVFEMTGNDDAGQAITRRIVAPPIAADRKLMTLTAIGFGAAVGSHWVLSVSRNGGEAYPIARTVTLEPMPARNRQYRFGKHRAHVIKMESTSAPASEMISGMEVR